MESLSSLAEDKLELEQLLVERLSWLLSESESELSLVVLSVLFSLSVSPKGSSLTELFIRLYSSIVSSISSEVDDDIFKFNSLRALLRICFVVLFCCKFKRKIRKKNTKKSVTFVNYKKSVYDIKNINYDKFSRV